MNWSMVGPFCSHFATIKFWKVELTYVCRAGRTARKITKILSAFSLIP